MGLLRMTSLDQKSLLSQLAGMPAFLEATLGGVSAVDAQVDGPDGLFSPVDQCWHLADLERDGYAVRITRLLSEVDPLLPGFDGARIAKERRYKTLSLIAGIQAFRNARLANLAALRAVPSSAWSRSGRQEGVGVVALCDVPAIMAGHDASHRGEIDAWVRMRRGQAGT